MLTWSIWMISHTGIESPDSHGRQRWGILDNGWKLDPTISHERRRAMPLVKLFRQVCDHDRIQGGSPSQHRASSSDSTGGVVFFGMTKRKGHVGSESGWKWKSPKTGGILLKSIHLSEIEESRISCVGVTSGDLWRKAKSKGNCAVSNLSERKRPEP